ncbi:MAG TPA: hypothetical protein VMJ10_37620 [Kofleriaceae bacterium]|nr:hypothetical protein [Kofleriaceae bacterium]
MGTALRVVVLALAACSTSSHTVGRDAGTHVDAIVRLDGLSCLPAASCATGPTCGTTCCAAGEACVSGVCMCGMQPACTDGNTCNSPVVSTDRCGSICCGATMVCPGVAPE